MADQGVPGFTVTPEMRAFAEQSVAQAKKAFDGFMAAAQGAVSAMEGRATAAQEGVKDMQRRAVSFAEQNVAASFDFARKLVAAKDPGEIMKLHADYVQAQMRTLGDQARELGQAATKATGTTQAKG